MKARSVVLGTLIIFGIVLSLYIYEGIIERKFLYAGSLFVAFLLTAMFAAKIMSEFRQLSKYVTARNKIRDILLPVTKSEGHASILAENLVLRRTAIKDWPEIPKEKAEAISLLLKTRKAATTRNS